MTTEQPALERPAAGYRRIPTIVVQVVNAARQHLPQYLYQRAWTAFNANDFATSERLFARAQWLAGENNTGADATFFRAASLLRGGRPAEAMVGYEDLIQRFPDSMWVIESHYHVGLCLRQLGRRAEAASRFRYVVEKHPGNRWATFSAGQLEQMQAEPGGLGG